MEILSDEKYDALVALVFDHPKVTYNLLRAHGFLQRSSLELLHLQLDTVTLEEARAVKQCINQISKRNRSAIPVNGRYLPNSLVSIKHYVLILKKRDNQIFLSEIAAQQNLKRDYIYRVMRILGIATKWRKVVSISDATKIIAYSEQSNRLKARKYGNMERANLKQCQCFE